jgi:hypothetical protein
MTEISGQGRTAPGGQTIKLPDIRAGKLAEFELSRVLASGCTAEFYEVMPDKNSEVWAGELYGPDSSG